jgi:hypothetical protein
MKTSESIANIASALSKTQAAIANAVKDTQGYGYKYADLAQILELVRPFLAQHGLSVFQSPGSTPDGQMTLTTRVMHSSGEWIETDTMSMPVEAKKGLSAAQCAGIVITYMRRYQLAPVFGIAQEDSDGIVREEQPKAQRQPQRQPEPEPPRVPDVNVLAGMVAQAGDDVAALRDVYRWAASHGYEKRHLDRIAARAKELSEAQAQKAAPAQGQLANLTQEQVESAIKACESVEELEEYRDHIANSGAPADLVAMVNASITLNKPPEEATSAGLDEASVDIVMWTLQDKKAGRRYYNSLVERGAAPEILKKVIDHCKTLPEGDL